MGMLAKKLRLETRLLLNRSAKASRAADRSLVQWGVVGPGYMGEQFACALGREPGMNVRAVYSRSQDRAESFARRHGGVGAYSLLSDMLASEKGLLDVVYVATPAASHYEVAAECLRAGFNVLCEKPLVPTTRQAMELYGLADSMGVQLLEGLWFRCLPTYAQAKAWIAEGRIGSVKSVDASIRKGEPGKEPSALLDFGAYVAAGGLDFVPGRGRIDFEVLRTDDAGGSDCDWEIRGHAEDGCSIRMALSNREAGDSALRIVGDCAQIVFPSQFNRADKVSLQGFGGEFIESRSFTYYSNGFEWEIRDVADAVRADGASCLDRTRSIDALQLMEALGALPEGESRISFDRA